jgi:hypothetical protein
VRSRGQRIGDREGSHWLARQGASTVKDEAVRSFPLDPCPDVALVVPHGRSAAPRGAPSR